MEASLRKREEEVRAQKERYEKEREKERGIHLHDKAVQHFNALLADMVCAFFQSYPIRWGDDFICKGLYTDCLYTDSRSTANFKIHCRRRFVCHYLFLFEIFQSA